MATHEGQAWKRAWEVYEQLRWLAPRCWTSVDRDGSFRIDDMPAGDYVLSIRAREKVPDVLKAYRFTVPPAEAGEPAPPVDLGTLTLEKP
jgi:hypothetical protein